MLFIFYKSMSVRIPITRKVLEHFYTADLASRQSQHWPLVDIGKINPANIRNKIEIQDLIHAKSRVKPVDAPIVDVIPKLHEYYDYLERIFDIGGKNVVLCGGVFSHRIYDNDINSWHTREIDCDFFIYGVDKHQAWKILQRCLSIFPQGHNVEAMRNGNVVSIEVRENNRTQKYQFILRAYSELSHILGGFDLWGSQIGYNPELGIFATQCGAFAISTGLIAIDLSRRSLSYGYRLNKYRDRGFGIIMPGYSQDDINTTAMEVNPDLRMRTHIAHGNQMPNTIGFYPKTHDKDDYGWTDGAVNWYFAAIGQPNRISWQSDRIADIFNMETLESKLDRRYTFSGTLPSQRATIIPRDSLRTFFNNEARTREFSIAYYIDNDLEKADAMWIQRNSELIEIIKSYFNTIQNEGMFNTIDPTTQCFGTVNPAILNPKEWYGPTYSPTYAGIHPDVYVTLRAGLTDPMSNFSKLNMDVFRYLMKFLLNKMAEPAVEFIETIKKICDINQTLRLQFGSFAEVDVAIL